MISGRAPSSSTAAGSSWRGIAAVKGSSESIRMILLTFSLIGIQFTWGIEMTYCTPYLLKLGLTKSRVSLVWIAGPLSGLIMQPIVGIFADRSKSPWGRRRPYMVGGTVVVSLCLLLLGWTSEFVSLFISSVEARKSMTVFLAVLSIYGVDFAINAVQSSARSLIVDTLPSSKQQAGSAWASRMVAVGHLIGYGVGALDLTRIFGTALGDTQFKQLILISAIALMISVTVTCCAVEERILLSTGNEDIEDGQSVLAMFSQIVTTAMNLPPRISAICWIQFWCWIGWFPFLFYSTTWVGEVYLRFNADAETRDHPDSLGQMGRVGSMTLIIFSLVTFAGSVVLPWLIEAPEEAASGFTPRPPAGIANFLLEAQKYKPSLLTAWMYSHIIFAGSMICAPFVTSLHAATMLIAMCGIPWVLQCWAPFTFLGMEINQPGNPPNGHAHKTRGSFNLNAKEKETLFSDLEKNSESSGSDLTGVYLGILNLYATLPQFIGTFISWTVFSILEPGKSPELAKEAHPDEHHSTDGPNAIAVCLFIGALAAVLAAYATKKLKP